MGIVRSVSDDSRFRRAPINAREHGVEEGGSIKKLPSGRFRAQFPRRIDPGEHNSHADGTTYATKEEAQTALKAMLTLHAVHPERFGFINDDEPEAEPDTRTVAIATQEFLDERHGLAPKTKGEYESIRRVVVCNEQYGIGDRIISELKPSDLTTWRDSTLCKAKVTPAQTAYAWRFLQSALSWAVEKDRLPTNPAKATGTKRRTQEDTAREVTPSRIPVPTWQEEMDLAVAVGEESRRLLMLLLMRGGCRFTEGASIPPDNIEPKLSRIYLEYQWRKGKGQPWVKRPLKNGHPRYMWVPQQLLERIVDYLENRWTPPVEDRKSVLFPYVGITGERPVRGGSGVWTPSEWRKQVMVPARTIAGLPTMRTKDLRMSAASNFADAGFTDPQVQEMVGHLPGSSVTGRHYVRPISDTHDEKRAEIRNNTRFSQEERLRFLWDAWVEACGDPFAGFPSVTISDE